MNFSKTIKQLRSEQGLSQEDLAEKLHIARQSISKWERGEAYPSIGALLRMSELFDVSVDELLKGDEHLKTTIIKDGEKIEHPRLVLFFDWLFLTGAALMLFRIGMAILTRVGVMEWEIAFLKGWLPAVITLALLLIGGVGSDELKKKVK